MLYATIHVSPFIFQLIPLDRITSLVSFLAALIALIAFAIDIALFVLTKNEIHNLGGVSSKIDPGPGKSPSGHRVF